MTQWAPVGRSEVFNFWEQRPPACERLGTPLTATKLASILWQMSKTPQGPYERLFYVLAHCALIPALWAAALVASACAPPRARPGRIPTPVSASAQLRTLERGPTAERSAAARWLGTRKHWAAVPALMRALRSNGATSLQIAALEALGRIGDPSAIPAVVSALDAPDNRVSLAALRALPGFPQAALGAAVPHLQRRLEHWLRRGDLSTKRAVVAALAAAGPPGLRRIRHWLRSFYNPNPRRTRAFPATGYPTLRAGGPPLLRYGIRLLIRECRGSIYSPTDSADRAVAKKILRAFGARAAARLVPRLHDEACYGTLMEVLARLPEAVPSLIGALKSKRPKVRRRSAQLLRDRARRSDVPALVEALKDPTPEVRYWVARALLLLEDQRAMKPLLAALGAPMRPATSGSGTTHDHVREAVYEVLTRFRHKAIPGLLRLLRLPGNPGGPWAIEALVNLETRLAIPALVRALDDPRDATATAAALGLGRIRDMSARPALLRKLKQGPAPVRLAALRSLGGYRTPAVIAAVMPLLRHPDTRWVHQAAVTLARLGAHAAIPRLLALMTHRDVRLHLTAVDALGWLASRKAVGPILRLRRASPVDSASWTAASIAPARIGGPRVNRLLRRDLGSANERIRHVAIAAKCILARGCLPRPPFEPSKRLPAPHWPQTHVWAVGLRTRWSQRPFVKPVRARRDALHECYLTELQKQPLLRATFKLHHVPATGTRPPRVRFVSGPPAPRIRACVQRALRGHLPRLPPRTPPHHVTVEFTVGPFSALMY